MGANDIDAPQDRSASSPPPDYPAPARPMRARDERAADVASRPDTPSSTDSSGGKTEPSAAVEFNELDGFVDGGQACSAMGLGAMVDIQAIGSGAAEVVLPLGILAGVPLSQPPENNCYRAADSGRIRGQGGREMRSRQEDGSMIAKGTLW